jgi:molybdopterin-guanine dinucleotide biosynthesis protein A
MGGPTQRAVGFVMAGGRSERMGRDKALLPWGESTLLAHAVARLRTVCDETRILCGPEPRYLEQGVTVLTDTVAGVGPLGGLWRGLQSLDRGVGLFLAVDLPDVPVAFLSFLLDSAQGWDAVVPVHSRGEEPLCAAYAASCLEPIRRRLEGGDLRMTSFWPEARVRRVTEDEIRPHGDPLRLFRNVNSPADLDRAGS